MKLIAPHILHRYEGDLGAPPAIKVAMEVPDVAYVRGLIERYPTTPIVLRFIDRHLDDNVPRGCGRLWFDRRIESMLAMNAPNVLWEFLNEVNQSRAVDYAYESMAWIDLMHGAGLRCVWPSTSTGTPMYPWEGPTQGIYDPVLAQLRPNDGCGPHEYFGNSVDSATPDHILRCTRWPELMRHDLYIGETGSDAGTPGGEAGWQNTFDGDLDTYLTQLERLDEVYRQYPQVKAAFVFSIGQTQFGWDAYNLDWSRVVALQEGGQPMIPIPDLARAMIQWDPLVIVVTADAAWHVAHGERKAVDLAGFHLAEIVSPWDGVVEFAFEDTSPRGRGLTCGIVRTQPMPNGRLLEVSPCHCSQLLVSEGQRVARGQPIAISGWTGYTVPSGEAGEHVHLVVYDNAPSMAQWVYVDPALVVADYVLEGQR